VIFAALAASRRSRLRWIRKTQGGKLARRRSVSSRLYESARTANDLETLASGGHPRRIVRRLKNTLLGRLLGRSLFRWLWKSLYSETEGGKAWPRERTSWLFRASAYVAVGRRRSADGSSTRPYDSKAVWAVMKDVYGAREPSAAFLYQHGYGPSGPHAVRLRQLLA
jgi:hypothetical protein